ncbi:MAG: hypothetical protein K0R84_1157 [Clostridia bacterium]|jgi:hypothetical protein|nr:hypothetical protein [Clostridia bacterium]
MYTVKAYMALIQETRLVGAGFHASPQVTGAVGGAAHSAPLRHTARHSERSEEFFAIYH